MFESAWQSEVLHKHGRKATKTDYIQFFLEVKEFLENETEYMQGLDDLHESLDDLSED